MTTFRSRAALYMVVAALTAAAPPTSHAKASWHLIYSGSEGLQKLIYGEEETEGEVYFRCTPQSGWVFFIHDYDPSRGKIPPLTVGNTSVTPLVRIDYDPVEDSRYLDAAIPANSPLLRELALGKPLHFDDHAYAVSNSTERSQIQKFLNICDVQGESH